MDLVVRGRFGWIPFQPAGWVTFTPALTTFRDALSILSIEPRTRSVSVAARRTKAGAQPSPLWRTPRKTSQPRPYAVKLWGAPRVEGLAAYPTPCAMCGKQILKAQAPPL
jgi:hypothetical protein